MIHKEARSGNRLQRPAAFSQLATRERKKTYRNPRSQTKVEKQLKYHSKCFVLLPYVKLRLPSLWVETKA